ncbi:MAG: sulfurtransferase TusA family protein [Bacteroidales bacterium]|nr:sulfurtransferase TusA family protein [Bacteroidales bacterium]MDD3858557.1 sulfurtransferase TusA family protein [Bacteroidales bacterium]
MQEYNSKFASSILDLRGQSCPDNLPKILLNLEGLNPGEVLEIILDDIIALDKIPDAIKEEPDFKVVGYKKTEHNIHLFIEVI